MSGAPLPPDPGVPDALAAVRWRRTLRLTALLLAVWLGVTGLATLGAEWLDGLLPGRHAAFWFGAQGALLLFLAIVVVYTRRMERIEDAADDDAADGRG